MAQPTTALHFPPAVVATGANAIHTNLARRNGFYGRNYKVEMPLQRFPIRLVGHGLRLPRLWLPTRCHVEASQPRRSSQPRTSKVIQAGDFVCRESEKQWLAQLLEGTRPQITILLGSSGSGKTSLLQHYIESCGKDMPQPSYMPCRSIQAKVAVGVQKGSSAMEELLAPYKRHLAEMPANKVLLPGPNPGPQQRSDRRQEMAGDAVVPSGRLNNHLGPILIDDAEELEKDFFKYSFEGPSALRFLRLLSKDQGVAHVVMATSSPTFTDWLEKGIGASSFTVCALGDLTEEHARWFFNMSHGSLVTDEVWNEVYEVCGGDMELLRQAATFDGSDLDPVLIPMWSSILTRLRNVVAEEVYRGENIKLVMEELVNARHHTVSLLTLDNKLEVYKMKFLLKLGLFTIRPYSWLAEDIPQEAHGEYLEPVVMPATPAHLYCMQKLVKKEESARTWWSTWGKRVSYSFTWSLKVSPAYRFVYGAIFAYVWALVILASS